MTVIWPLNRIPRPGRGKKGDKGLRYTIKYIRELMILD